MRERSVRTETSQLEISPFLLRKKRKVTMMTKQPIMAPSVGSAASKPTLLMVNQAKISGRSTKGWPMEEIRVAVCFVMDVG